MQLIRWWSFDPHRARPQRLGRLERAVVVLGPHRRGQAVDGVVGHSDRLGVVGDLDDREHWPEDLPLRDRHRVVDAGEDRRLEVVALAVRARGGRAAEHDLRALLAAEAHVVRDGLELLGRDQRPEIGVVVHRVAELQRARPRHQLLHELVVDRRRHDQPRARLAHLALVEEGRPQRAVDRRVHVRVLEDDVRRLAAELERELLDRRRGQLHDPPPDHGRAGERDLVHVRVGRELLAHRGAAAGDDVDHALGQVGLVEQLGQAQRGQRRVRGPA
jgi:ParB family chromosome partitioning protein